MIQVSAQSVVLVCWSELESELESESESELESMSSLNAGHRSPVFL